MSKNISIAIFCSIILHAIFVLNVPINFNNYPKNDLNKRIDISLIQEVREKQKKEVEVEKLKPLEEPLKEIKKEEIVPQKELKRIDPIKKEKIKPIKKNKIVEEKPLIKDEIVNTHLEGIAEKPTNIIKTNNNFNDDKVKIFIPNEKVEPDESAYIKSIIDKIKNYATNFYPMLAKGTNIKLKLIIDKNGFVEVDQLSSNRSQEINEQIIKLIKQLTPYSKPTVINTEKVIIIRTFIFE